MKVIRVFKLDERWEQSITSTHSSWASFIHLSSTKHKLVKDKKLKIRFCHEKKRILRIFISKFRTAGGFWVIIFMGNYIFFEEMACISKYKKKWEMKKIIKIIEITFQATNEMLYVACRLVICNIQFKMNLI